MLRNLDNLSRLCSIWIQLTKGNNVSKIIWLNLCTDGIYYCTNWELTEVIKHTFILTDEVKRKNQLQAHYILITPLTYSSQPSIRIKPTWNSERQHDLKSIVGVISTVNLSLLKNKEETSYAVVFQTDTGTN